MRLANTVFFAIATTFAAAAHAQLADRHEITFWGIGHTKCTAVLDFVDAKDSVALDALVTWSQGYLSAKVEEQVASGATLFRLLSPEIIEDQMIGYCSSNRGKRVSDAAHEFGLKLTR